MSYFSVDLQLIEPISKAEYLLGVSRLICKGYLELIEMRAERELQNQKFLLTVGFEPRTFRLRCERATNMLRGPMTEDLIKVHLVLLVLFLEFYLQHMVNEEK